MAIADLAIKYAQFKQVAVGFNMTQQCTSIDLSTKKRQLDEAESQLMSYRTLQDIQAKSIEVMKELMDKMSQNHIAAVKHICSAALAQVFHDKSYDIDIVVDGTKASKTADFFLLEKLEDGTVKRTPFKDAQDPNIGGGILATVGMLFQVFYVFYNKCEPLVFMDEALSQLSNTYLTNLFDYLKVVCKEKNFKLVLIAQDPRIKELADKYYDVKNGEVTLMTIMKEE